MATPPEALLEGNASDSITMRGVREIMYGSVRATEPFKFLLANFLNR
jgi:hypothetical protein